MRRPARLLAVVVPLVLPLFGFGSCDKNIIDFGLPSPSGGLPVSITLPPGTAATATVTLDGVDVTAAFAAGGPGLVGSVPVPAAMHTRLCDKGTCPFRQT